MFPAASNSLVVLIPISVTFPLNPSIVIVSPVLNSFSKIMKIPAIISAINVCAPSPTINVKTPTEAINASVSTPQAFNTKIITAIAHPYFTNPSNNETTVLVEVLTLKKYRSNWGVINW